MTLARLHDLPSEIYSTILSFIPSSDLQQTVLSLSRAVPYSPVPLHLLYRSIRLKRPEQVILLESRLRTASKDAAKNDDAESPLDWIREFSLECWTADAEVVINLFSLIPKLESLSVWIGAKNFTPEHLEELFTEPIHGLKYLSLRFRPYVQQANYYQFLKGAYFDSTLRAISRWPQGSVPILSIMQDPLDPRIQVQKTFAQPIVFFQLDPYLSLMLHSRKLSSLRLRIPSRPVTRSLCHLPPPHVVEDMELYIPPLTYLDLSTCSIIESDMETIMVRFKALKHLVLDGCSMLRWESREGGWSALGKWCAMIGVTRAREREKKLKAYLETQAVAAAQLLLLPDGDVAEQAHRPSRVRRGRRGLATATISLRDRPEQPAPTPGAANLPRGTIPKIRILPPLPSLVTLCLTTSATVKPDQYATVRAEFTAGWVEGIGLLRVNRARLRTSAANGVRVVRFIEGDHNISDSGLDGLEDVDRKEDGAFDVPTTEDGLESVPAPILCFAGDRKDADHVVGCGHSVGWDIWKDEPGID